MELVRTLFCKYDGRPHRQVDSIRLGEDEHGLWVGSLPGGLGRRGDGRWVSIDHARVRVFPRNAWWSALFNDEPHETEVYCDVITPAEIHDDTVTTVDLDLDVRRYRDGRVRVLDEDEFEAHRVKYRYPDHVVDTARLTCEWIAAHIGTSEPFTSAYKRYLDRTRALAHAIS
jgi:protein associated with RNAse G/E